MGESGGEGVDGGGRERGSEWVREKKCERMRERWGVGID